MPTIPETSPTVLTIVNTVISLMNIIALWNLKIFFHELSYNSSHLPIDTVRFSKTVRLHDTPIVRDKGGGRIVEMALTSPWR